MTDTDIHPPLCIPDMILPNGIIFQNLNIASAVMGVSTLLPKVNNHVPQTGLALGSTSWR
jgi:hypothetical protein